MSDKEAKSSQENLAGSHAEKSKPQERAPLKKKNIICSSKDDRGRENR